MPKWAVAVGAACAISTSAAAGEMPSSKAYELVKVGEGIYAFVSPESNTPIVSGNSVAVVGDDGVLVVDSGNFPTLARRVIADIRRITNKPVRWLVHTHWHPDHLMGDSAFREAFPDLHFVSTDFTRDQIAQNAPKYIRGTIEKGPAYVQMLEERLRTGKEEDGTVMSPAGRRLLERAIADVRIAIPEFQQATLVVPDLTFDRSLTLHLGAREVRISFLGRANTGGDAVIFIPDAKVLVTGDVLVFPTPYSYGSYPAEWIEVLKKLMTFDAGVIVPGHGPVMRDWEYPKLLVALLESVRAQVGRAVSQNASLEETRKRVDLESFRARFAGSDPDRSRVFHDAFVVPAVERAYQEAKGSFAPES